jgi:uncharacterized surface protein with fasciclin (FAS1) repeats
MKHLLFTLAIVGSFMAGSSQASSTEGKMKTIVEIAATTPGFETLVEAVKAAGLVETLNGEGPFTVFAPTNNAFAKIPKNQLESLLADKAALTNVLLYHVVPGKVEAAEVLKSACLKMANEERTEISVQGGSAFINSARILQTDIEASNGVIHVIDEVLLP